MAGVLKKDLAKDYGLTLSWRFGEVEFLGLPKLKDDRVHRLEHIYVPLRLCREWKDRFDADKTFHVPQVLQKNRRLIVLGDPGSGKSTLVKVLTYAFGEARDNPYKRACGELIPIPIILRAYNTRRWQNYQDMLRDFIATLDDDIRSDVTPEWLFDNLAAGKAILLIDGVDEVGSREDREHLRDQVIRPLLKEAPRAWAFITSRVVGYDEVPFELVLTGEQRHSVIEGGLECYYVAPFNDEEIKQFVTRWYALRESFPDKQKEGVESLMGALNQNDRVKRLANNPQLLTLVALIHRVTANLPSGRVELYDKIVEAYLETIQVFRKLGTPARLDEMKRWLANVGWRMQTRRDEMQTSDGKQSSAAQGDELLVTRAEIKSWLIEAIERERGTEEAPDAAERFLDYVARRSGLLVPRGPEEFSFVHLTFQEYFAAFALRGRVRNFQQLADECVRLVEKRHWHETLNLLFEMLTEFPGACDDLFTGILSGASNSYTAAEFISLLLPDEQSGLSLVNQFRAAEFVLDSVCVSANSAIIKNLRQVSPALFNKWITDPLTERLRNGATSNLPKHFFWVGSELVENWETTVCETIERRADEPWPWETVAAMTLTCRSFRSVAWASERLDLRYWVSPFNLLQRTLVDEFLTALLDAHRRSPRQLFLAQIALISVHLDVQLLRLSLVVESGFHHSSPSKLIERAQKHIKDSPFFTSGASILGGTPASTKWTLIRVMATNLIDFDPDVRKLFWSAVLTNQTSISESLQGSYKSEHDKLVKLGIAATLPLDNPEGSDLEPALHLLNQALSSPDDWRRLIATYYLISLGKGTPQRCSEFNQLLNLAINEPERFSLPQQFRALVRTTSATNEFSMAMRMLFGYEPGEPLLKPEWFDPCHEVSKFFLTTPAALLKLAAEVLGTTEV